MKKQNKNKKPGKLAVINRRPARGSSWEKAEELDRFFKLSLDLICIADIDGNFLRLNRSWETTLGYRLEELEGKRFFDFIHPDDIESTNHAVAELSKGKDIINFINRYRCKDGSYRWIEWRSSPYEKKLIYAAARDITERKLAEDALRESEEKYRLLATNIPHNLWIIDINTLKYVYANPYSVNALGYSDSETLSLNIKQTMTPRTFEFVTKTIAEELANDGKPGVDPDRVKTYELEQLHKNGSIIWTEVSVKFVRDKTGRITGIQGISRDISERKRTQMALEESEKRYRTVLDTMEEGLLENDLEGNYTFVNDAACKLLGYERDEIVGMNYRRLYSPDNAKYIEKVYQEIYKTGEPRFLMDHEIIRKDGSVRFYQANAALLRDSFNKPKGFRILARDITERRDIEEKYRTILETMNEGLFENDLNGNYTFVNDAGCKMVGYEREELIGRNFRETSSPELAKYLYEVFRRVYETGNTEMLVDYEVRHKDGSVRIHQSHPSLIRDSNGKPIGFRNLVRDVTDLKNAEKHRNSLQMKIIEQQKEIIEINKAYSESLEQKVEDRTYELKDALEKLKEFDKLKSNFLANISHEIRTPLTLIISPVESALQGDNKKGVDEVFLQNIQRNAIRLHKLINNLLDFSKIEAGKMNLKVNEIDMVQIINNYIKDAKPTADSKGVSVNVVSEKKSIKLFLDIEKFDKIAMNVFSNALKFTERGGRIEIRIKDDESNCYIVVEDTGIGIPSDKLGTIFDRFSQVDLSPRRKYEGTGIGLSLARELIELSGGSISVTSKYIENNPDDHGTVFTVIFPKGKKYLEARNDVEFIKAGDLDEVVTDKKRLVGIREMVDLKESYSVDLNEEIKAETTRLQNKNQTQSHILVIEDNSDMRDFLKTLLQEHYTVFFAVDGLDGLNKTRELIPDLIVTDVMMPTMDGYTMTKMIKEDESLKRIPVLMLTAKVDIAHKIEGLEYGADDYLTKPFNSKELLVRIKTLLKTREYEKIIETRNEEIENELLMARQLQQKLLPESIPEISGYRSNVAYIPMDQVGGDFYDFKANDAIIELFIADVSGHGLHGAFISMITKMAFESIRDRKSTRNVLYILNDIICRSTVPPHFVTACYCIINREKNTMSYSNAGHLPPLVFRQTNGEILELTAHGPPLGLSKKMELEEVEIQLNKSDRLFLFTDGITECRDPERKFFGDDRFMNFIRSNSKLSPNQFTEKLLSDLRSFSCREKFDDDLCLIVFDVL